MMTLRSTSTVPVALVCGALAACAADTTDSGGSAGDGLGTQPPIAGSGSAGTQAIGLQPAPAGTAGTVMTGAAGTFAATGGTAPPPPPGPGDMQMPGDMPPMEPTPPPPPPVDMTPPPPDDTMPPPDDGGGTTTPGGGVTDISGCMPPPDGTTATGIQAWTMLNEIRLAAGAGCINTVPELVASAQNHCDYLAMNASNGSCAGSHSETPGCAGFTGETVGAREIAAGYPRQLAYTEVLLSYGDNPERSIPGWLVTPFHRIPMLDPWTTDMGWGGGPGCDIIDFGRGMEVVPDDKVVIFPYDGQVDVPPSFNGLEAPMPPPPAGGFPSSYPVSIYAKGMSITEHVLTKDGDAAPIDHLWLDKDAPEVNAGLRSYFNTTALLYGAPFEANTTYRVKITGTHTGGALNLEWTFTTGAPSNPWGF